MRGMAPRTEPRTMITITAAYDRILEDDEQRAVSDNLAGFLSGERGMITSGRDSAGPYTWQTFVDDAMTVTGWTDRIGYACAPASPAAHARSSPSRS